MRLINVHTHELEELIEEEGLKYAILSHTWGPDEISYAAFVDHCKESLSSSKPHGLGFSQKLRMACKVAKLDGWKYLWVDTCCIDKGSSAELSEAINSMYRWYRDAQVCYAYLSDVDKDGFLDSFHTSRWFSRGWTLQEMLAPPRIKLFSNDWQVYGWGHDLADLIAKRTGIPQSLLEKQAELDDFTVAQRLSWAAERQTTRVEDRAYSLMGLFDVNMPLLYGEGVRAFQRLQEEILRMSDDQSILAWGHRLRLASVKGLKAYVKDIGAHPGAILAPSPTSFKDCGDVIAIPDTRRLIHFQLTNRGLDITLPVITSGDCQIGLLGCRQRDSRSTYLGLLLVKESIMYRWHTVQENGEDASTVEVTNPDVLAQAEMQTVTIRNSRLSSHGRFLAVSRRRGSAASLDGHLTSTAQRWNVRLHWDELEKADYEVVHGAAEYRSLAAAAPLQPAGRWHWSAATSTITSAHATREPAYLFFVFKRKEDERGAKPRILLWVDLPFGTHVPFAAAPLESAATNVQFLVDAVLPHRTPAELQRDFDRSKYRLATEGSEWSKSARLPDADKVVRAAAHRFDILDQWVLHLKLTVSDVGDPGSGPDAYAQELHAAFKSWWAQKDVAKGP